MLDSIMQFAISEMKENNRQVDVQEVISELNKASMLFSKLAKYGNEDEKDQTIDGLGAIISAMNYMSLMNGTIEAYKSLEGGEACVY